MAEVVNLGRTMVDQSIDILWSCHTILAWMPWTLMQNGRTQRSEKTRKTKKGKRRRKELPQERQKRPRRQMRRSRRRGGLGWLSRSRSVWNCLWHCCTTGRLPLGFDFGLAFPASKIATHWHVLNIQWHLWQVEMLQGEWEHSKRGIGTGNLSCFFAAWFLLQVWQRQKQYEMIHRTLVQ